MSTDPEQSTVLTCSSITVEYQGCPALASVDLTIGAGEWIGLIGPNGAGKSTLLRSIAGLTPYSGSITRPDGGSPTALDLALVPQSPLFPLGMTVAEYVLLGRTAHLGWLARESRADHQIAADVLQRLDLQRFAPRAVASLSGGEAQRVVVARALAQQAPLLLLDEPTSALDVGHQANVLELVDDLRRDDGLTVVAAMHDLTTAARFADRLALLHRGELVADGSPASVLDPALLSEVYETPLSVRTIDDELVVLASPRSKRHPPPDGNVHR